VAPRKNFEDVLLTRGLISGSDLDAARKQAELEEIPLYEYFLTAGVCSEDVALEALAESLMLPFRPDLEFGEVDMDQATRIPEHFLLKHCLVPVKSLSGRTTVASHNPLDLHPLDDLRAYIGADLEMLVVPRSRLEEVMAELIRHRYRSTEDAIQDLKETDVDVLETEFDETDNLLGMANEAPVIRLVNSFLDKGMKNRASDIHIEPQEHDIRIRYRIDGVLHDMAAPPKRYLAAIVSRIKIISGLDIAERRLPQDGRIKLRIKDAEADVRVSTVPAAFGERVVLRLLRTADVLHSLELLGMAADTLTEYRKLIHRSYGIMLVCGPTGSGKTTSLYGALVEIASPALNIMTVEDPIEYQIAGVSQIQVKPKIDFGFAEGLRCLLRQDPDIIMVGEIRDLETARMAVQAALTGHLVLSTLHTNDAASAAVRLSDMGIPGYLVSSTLLGALSQRLVRKVCVGCAEPISDAVGADLFGDIDETVMKNIRAQASPDAKAQRGRGCEACLNTGYLGRTGLFEMLTIDDEIRRLIASGRPTNEIAALACKKGMINLRADGLRKVMGGITTIEEVLRVTER